MRINIHHVLTSDDLRLQGVEYEPDKKDLCMLFVHGMSGNFIENYVAQVLGEKLSNGGIGFIYGHNRGYNHINDICTSEKDENGGNKSKRIGVVYEIFEECIFDIDSWIKKTLELGYKRIVLAGHSLGAPKVIYYNSIKSPNLSGVVLLSPGDMVGLIKKSDYQPNSDQLYLEAENNVRNGEPRKLLSSQIWDWYNLSSQTFLSLYEVHGPVDNLPLHEANGDFTQLSKINAPILAVMGEYDDIAIDTLENDLDMIEEKASGTKSFTKVVLAKANHIYDSQEENLAETILNWINTTIK